MTKKSSYVEMMTVKAMADESSHTEHELAQQQDRDEERKRQADDIVLRMRRGKKGMMREKKWQRIIIVRRKTGRNMLMIVVMIVAGMSPRRSNILKEHCPHMLVCMLVGQNLLHIYCSPMEVFMYYSYYIQFYVQ